MNIRKKLKLHAPILCIGALAVVLIILLLNTNISQSPKNLCQEEQMNWLEEYNECEYMVQETCEELGGVYNECGSACRHDPEAQYCILMCVPYCNFN